MVYELGTFFQNFRRYVRSYDPTRMHDGSSSGAPASACDPAGYLNGDDGLPINPCGTIAASFFNDSFAFAAAGAPLAVDSSSIAWDSDRDNLYGDVPAENYNPGGCSLGAASLGAQPVDWGLPRECLLAWPRVPDRAGGGRLAWERAARARPLPSAHSFRPALLPLQAAPTRPSAAATRRWWG